MTRWFKFMHLPAIAPVLLITIALSAGSAPGQTPPPDGPCLVLYAFDAEGRLLAEKMTIEKTDTILGRAVQIGRLADERVVLAESGIGMTNAAMTTQKLIDTFHPKAIIFSGIAGAIDTSIHIGDITVCRVWSEHDYGYLGKDSLRVETIEVFNPARDTLAEMSYYTVDSALYATAEKLSTTEMEFAPIGQREPRLTVGGAGVSGNMFIDNREKRLWLSDRFNALVVDMESAAVAQVGTVNGVPFIIFRSASDLAGGSGSATARGEIDQFFQTAADNAATVVLTYLQIL
ncbi:MAG: 5'-methylthioadenosine/S-adenosylhomocysteine nucleosidase [candidate division Zixibacteria bacterium]|nr:5'-methylthioadenosine/S-adenosylhomocysteine nucleosidase [candidate division Zixibacteria bacterium]